MIFSLFPTGVCVSSLLHSHFSTQVVKCVDLTDSSLNHYNNPHQPRYR